MSMSRNLSRLAIGSILILGACSSQDRAVDSRANRVTPGTAVMRDPLNAGTPGIGVNDRIGGPGSAGGAAAIPGGPSGGGSGGTGTRNQGYGAPIR